jgi:hypothetical protein
VARYLAILKAITMIYGRTGELCSISGVYRCFGNFELKVCLKAGELFPKAMDLINAFWILAVRVEEDQLKTA